jgi:hypothetical protein
MATKIIISRKSEWINRARGFKLFLDGNEMGKIANGGSEEYVVEPGVHSIQCKIDWCSSPELTVELKEGETKFLKASSGMKYYTVGYIFLILSLGAGPILKLMGIQRPENLSTISVLILVPFLLYMTYYLSIGRKKYIFLAEDKENFFN